MTKKQSKKTLSNSIKIRKKRCKVCNESFTPFNSLQKVCSTPCAILFAKEKKAKESKSLNKFKKKYKDEKKLPKELEKTKHVVHKFIRERDVNKPCISCGGAYRSNFDAGHFYPSGKFSNIKFDLDNIHAQCIKCNRYNEGEFENYSLMLPNRIGQKAFDSLKKKAALSKKHFKKWTIYELEDIRSNVKVLLKSIK